MDRSRVGVFIGYVANTAKQFLIWAPDRREAIKTSNLVFLEEEAGGLINLKLTSKYASSTPPDRNQRGRPRIERVEPQASQAETTELGGSVENTGPVGDSQDKNDPTQEPSSVGVSQPEPTERQTRSKSAAKTAKTDS